MSAPCTGSLLSPVSKALIFNPIVFAGGITDIRPVTKVGPE